MGWFIFIGKSKESLQKLFQRKPHYHMIPSSIDKLEANDSHEAFKEDAESRHHIDAGTFMFQELAVATNNFSADCLLGKREFGKIYKGRLENTNQVVAIKQLNPNGNGYGLQGTCGTFMSLLPDRKPLDWNTRMKIALGIAKGLEYMHDKAKSPAVIHGDLNCSNILLDEGYSPKLSDLGLAKNPVGYNDKLLIHRITGHHAPEFLMIGHLTWKSDVYSFGVVLLEIITGRKAIDISRAAGERILVSWARSLCKDPLRLSEMADPLLQGQYPVSILHRALEVAAICIHEEQKMRPLIATVVTALTHLASKTYDLENETNSKTAPHHHGSSSV